MDISSLSVAELRDLLNRIPAEIKRREREEKANLLKELSKLATERGFSLDELLQGAEAKVSKASKGSSVAPKYRSPNNAAVTWTGRGRQPIWVRDALASGMTLEQLAI